MEVVMQTQEIISLFSSLGCPVGDEYIPGDDCQATLEEILSRLYKEDKYVRAFRCVISNSQVLKKDLLPLFYNVKNDYKILDLIIEILENLMIPVECLLPIDIMIKEDAGRSTIYQLNWLLTACKEAFLNPCATKSVIDYMKLIIKKEQQLTSEGSNSISLCLVLLRNLLHIPEVRGGAPGGGASHQNQIIWHLFTQHVDKVLIQLMSCGRRRQWGSYIVQLISLLYKDQHSNTLYKLLNIWCDTALTESSEDDESNTSPQDQASGDSSSMATSDPTSDSSDSDHQKHTPKSEVESKHQCHPKQVAQTRMTEMLAHGNGRKAQVAMRNKHGNSKNTHPAKHRQPDHSHPFESQTTNKMMQGTRMCWGSESGLGSSVSTCGSMKMEEESECGYVSQNQETISTSSNEDKEPSRFGKKKTILQKSLHMIQTNRYNNGKLPLTCQARKELRREKLMKRSKTTTMSIKTFLNHTPSEEDIAHLLKEFTVDFLLKGYGLLVSDLKLVVLSTQDLQMDTSHFTWLIMFFLPFATQLELDLDLISPILSHDTISYLTYEGVNLCEELEVAKLDVGEKLTGILSKLYLIVSCLKEIIITVEVYRKVTHLTKADREYLKQLQEKICHTNDLKYLFILLLRHFDPMVHSHQFLQETVVANHNLLVLIENCPKVSRAAVLEHLRQFASEDVMKQYGVLLACYMDNGEMVNNCIFTMMHHVAGDLEKVSVLFQPSILKSFTMILKTEFEIRDDWTDLVEYVVQKCLKTKQIKAVPTGLNISVDEDEEMAADTAHREITSVPVQEPTEPEQQKHKETTLRLVKEISGNFISLGDRWSKEDLDSLCWYFSQSVSVADPIGQIRQLFLENCGQTKTRTGIVENLWKQGLILENQYKNLLAQETSLNDPETIQNKNTEIDILEGIQVIIDYLYAENKGFFCEVAARLPVGGLLCQTVGRPHYDTPRAC
ncbi:protein timeless-like isoform X1 [Homalodisca vitripennis]|uniref:protein timeless-like isoform X1 n=1 Tax=Homalodisca vitripennis TaxID=197043 RepID=UPI001EEB7412|nr:protein timeless-like isoform X1 [Homalodisca vitripennis]XP_046676927.1 protein timeless-like isoform X1 [Homalodisca vitripennis]